MTLTRTRVGTVGAEWRGKRVQRLQSQGGEGKGQGRGRADKEAPSSEDSHTGSWVLAGQVLTSGWGKPAMFCNSWFDIMKAEP